METNIILEGDCLQKLKDLPNESVDSIVTDPPYGLKFMGKSWDYDVPSVEIWKECFRVLKSGGHLLSFSGTRTYHRMACNIEDVGFEIRDMIEWVYGSGFPKSLNIGKAVDKLQGNEREETGIVTSVTGNRTKLNTHQNTGKWAVGIGKQEALETKGISEWEGWGTALKPAHEPIVMARKPLAEKTVAENVLKWGTGGINIDECRIGTEPIPCSNDIRSLQKWKEQDGRNHKELINPEPTFNNGRFPANLIHDGSEEVLGEFEKAGVSSSKSQLMGKGTEYDKGNNIYGKYNDIQSIIGHNDSGTPARFFETCEFSEEDYPPFFYCAKASKSERNKGCEELEDKKPHTTYAGDAWSLEHLGNTPANYRENVKNNHPTVKPLALMKYLVKLVTPKNGIVLDPFAGSGTTLISAKLEGYSFIGIEMEPEYINIARARLDAYK